jgi:hypothetical protein
LKRNRVNVYQSNEIFSVAYDGEKADEWEAEEFCGKSGETREV